MQRLAALPPPLRAGATLLLALAAALAAVHAELPLPWIIGPLLATAACGVAGLPLAELRPLRNAGQWMIGVALGLYFTPQVLAPALLAGIVWALLMGWAFYRWLWWLHRREGTLHRATAFFAAAIGGASEMAVLAERHGGQVDRVAAAHSLRVLLVVVLIPFGYQAAGIHGADAALPGVQAVQPIGLALLLAASLLGVGLVLRLRWPNPWVLGALAVTAALTGSGVELSALPAWMSQAAQLFIGVSLGTRFTPAFARAAPRWLAGVAAGTLAMIAASGAFAWALATLAGLHPATVMLGTSPGGIAEMCITAKVLQLGVPVVTALHVTRYVAVLVLTPLLYRRAAALESSPGRP
jgi:hypothetical protein